MPTQMNRSPCPRPERGLFTESHTPGESQQGDWRETRRPERANVTLTEATQNGKKVTRFKCVVAQVDIINRNGRFYPRSAYEAAIAAAADDLAGGKLWALMEHADDWDDPMKGRLDRIAGLYDSLTIEGDNVVGEGVIPDTDMGRNLKALFEVGVAVGVSTSCTGTARYLPASEVSPGSDLGDSLVAVMQDDLRFVTIDFVSDPSNPAGRAQAAERAERKRPAPSAKPEKEGSMHPKLKKLLEKYSVGTLAELLALEDARPEVEAILQEGTAPAPAATSQASGESVSLTDYRALEETVVELRGQVTNLTEANHNAQRDAIAITALEAARLPSAGTVKRGDSEIDLDASFRAELIGAARAAESADAAKDIVDSKITERRAVLGQREGTQPQRKENRYPSVAAGNTERAPTESERQKRGDGSRQLEGTRRTSGLI